MLHFLIGLAIVAGLLSFTAGRIVLLVVTIIGGLVIFMVLDRPFAPATPTTPTTMVARVRGGPQPAIPGDIVGAETATPEELAKGAKMACWDPATHDPDNPDDDPYVGQRICAHPAWPAHLQADCTETDGLLMTLPVAEAPSQWSTRMRWYSNQPKAYQACLLNRVYRGLDRDTPEGRGELFKVDALCKRADWTLPMLPEPNTAWFHALNSAQQICVRAAASVAFHALPNGSEWAGLAADTSCSYVDWTIARAPFPGPARAAWLSALPKTELGCIIAALRNRGRVVAN